MIDLKDWNFLGEICFELSFGNRSFIKNLTYNVKAKIYEREGFFRASYSYSLDNSRNFKDVKRFFNLNGKGVSKLRKKIRRNLFDILKYDSMRERY